VHGVRLRRIALVTMAGVLAGPVAVGLGGAASVEPLPLSFCSPVVQGSAAPEYLIVSDLPIRASRLRAFTLAMQGGIKFMLAHRGFKAGGTRSATRPATTPIRRPTRATSASAPPTPR